jgi:hypothetical protein
VREFDSLELLALQAVLGDVRSFDRRHQDFFERTFAPLVE